ncbi:MAG: hypothetical protein R3C05_06730 [Pirellulaceae bacterium]
MASIIKGKSGSYEIRFKTTTDLPQRVRARNKERGVEHRREVGASLHRDADTIAHPSRRLTRGLAAIDDRLHSRLAGFG